MSLASRIKRMRYDKGWGPAQLAEAAGVSRTAIFQIESGETIEPRASVAKKLADALEVSVEDLMGFEPFSIQADEPGDVAQAVDCLPSRAVER